MIVPSLISCRKKQIIYKSLDQMQDNQMDLMHSCICLPLDTKLRNFFAYTKLLFDKTPQTQPPNYFRPNLKKTIKKQDVVRSH